MSLTLQYFQAYCQLNDLPFDESRWVVGESIIQQEKRLHSLSRWSFFLNEFDQYCKGEIELEPMMTLGDGMNPKRIQQSLIAHEAVSRILSQMAIDEDTYTNEIVVVDQIAMFGHDTEEVRAQLSARGSDLCILNYGVGNEDDDE